MAFSIREIYYKTKVLIRKKYIKLDYKISQSIYDI